jgi:hypothetical protein
MTKSWNNMFMHPASRGVVLGGLIIAGWSLAPRAASADEPVSLLGNRLQLAQAPTPAPTVAPAPPAEAAAPTGLVIHGISLSAQIEGGMIINPSRPNDGLNVGSLFTDHANQFQLNQVLLTAQKLLDPKDSDYQWGFKFQVMYGSDARYTHFLGEFSKVTGDRNQFDIVEANIQAHLPWLTEGGIDVKAGQFVTLLGAETIDPSTNPFYSHSYIFNFGIPFKHTGVTTVTHVTSLLDIYLGADTGVNTWFGPAGENNGAIAGVAGFGLNLLGGNLTINGYTHFGPENPTRVLSPAGFNANGYYRFLNDVVIIWKATEALTFTTDANYIRDDFFRAEGYGIAQYVAYTLTDTITLNARAEVWRDQNNFFVAAFPGNLDFVNAESGFAAPNVKFAPRAVTYAELTLGFTYKPALPEPISSLMIRPEIRWDSALNGVKAFNGQRDSNMFTVGADAVVKF